MPSRNIHAVRAALDALGRICKALSVSPVQAVHRSRRPRGRPRLDWPSRDEHRGVAAVLRS